MRFVAPPGSSEFVKRWNPRPGDIVSFKHRGFLFSSKKPKLPALSRMRPDLTWDNVVANWKEKKPSVTGSSAALARSANLLPLALPLRTPSSKYVSKGYWAQVENRRQFLIGVAKEMGFDPYQPSNWNRVTNAMINKKKVLHILYRLAHFADSLAIG